MSGWVNQVQQKQQSSVCRGAGGEGCRLLQGGGRFYRCAGQIFEWGVARSSRGERSNAGIQLKLVTLKGGIKIAEFSSITPQCVTMSKGFTLFFDSKTKLAKLPCHASKMKK